MRKIIVEEPFASIVSREWLRAKRILPVLKKKPKVYWFNGRVRGRHSTALGVCARLDNSVYLYEGYRKMSNHHEFVLTLRHEFAHLPRPTNGSHGSDFMWWLKKLGGSRYAKQSRTQIRKSAQAEGASSLIL